MKKTVQIVTIPLGESSKLAKKDTSDKYELAEGETVFVNGIGYTPQQLLVLSDDEIVKDDSFYHSVCNKVFKATSEDVARIKFVKRSHKESVHTWITIKPNHYARKVIASYPQLEGTLPISKETVQAWIDAGTPVDASVEIKHKSIGRNTIGTTPAGEPIKMNSFIETPKLDSQGNLLLEFAQPFKSTMPIYTVPSIPTDEEIEKKADKYAYEIKGQLYTEKGQHPANKAWSLLSRGYTDGYKQALIDLGISK